MYLIPLLLLFLYTLTCCASAAIAPSRITCIGDSITEGSPSSPCGSLSYVTLLQKQLGNEAYKVWNAGNSSKTMSRHGKCKPIEKQHMQKICSYWSTTSWRRALTSAPHVVTIMLGTNDAKQHNWHRKGKKNKNTYVEDYNIMLRRLEQLTPSPHIFVLIPPTVTQNKFDIDSHVIDNILPPLLHQIVQNFTAIADMTATSSTITTDETASNTPLSSPSHHSHSQSQSPASRVKLVDIHGLFTAHDDLKSLICLDGVHLTPAGNKLVADTLFGLISNLHLRS